jgi:ABC-type sugar transport system substrate-binding protein
VLGTPGSSPAAERHLGFAQALAAYPQLHLVAQVQGDWRPTSVRQQLPAVLRVYPDADLLFVHNDQMAQAAHQVARQLSPGSRLRITGVDGLAGPGNGLELVEAGALQTTLLYPTGGEQAIRTALRILRHLPYEERLASH